MLYIKSKQWKLTMKTDNLRKVSSRTGRSRMDYGLLKCIICHCFCQGSLNQNNESKRCSLMMMCRSTESWELSKLLNNQHCWWKSNLMWIRHKCSQTRCWSPCPSFINIKFVDFFSHSLTRSRTLKLTVTLNKSVCFSLGFYIVRKIWDDVTIKLNGNIQQRAFQCGNVTYCILSA